MVYAVVSPTLNWTTVNDVLPQSMYSQCIGINKKHHIYLFGGNQKEQNIGIWKWNGKYPISFKQVNESTPTTYFACLGQNSVSIDNLVYFIGVYDSAYSPTGKTYIFDMNKEIFLSTENILTMPTPLLGGCVATNNEHIYYIGGVDSQQHPRDCIQIFNVQSQTWTQIIPYLPKKLSLSSCIIIDDGLYSFGGNAALSTISQVYKYNISANKVANDPISHLTEARACSSVINLNKYVYVIGGYIHPLSDSKRVDLFNSENEEILSHNMSNLVFPIATTSVTIINYSIMVFGAETNGTTNPMHQVQISNQLIYPSDSTFELPLIVYIVGGTILLILAGFIAIRSICKNRNNDNPLIDPINNPNQVQPGNEGEETEFLGH